MESIGEKWAFVLMLLSFGGFILWIVIFVVLADLSKDLRRKPSSDVVLRCRIAAIASANDGCCDICTDTVTLARLGYRCRQRPS